MALVRWEPIRELSSLQSDLNRAFNTFFEVPHETGSRQWRPSLDSGGGPGRDR